MKFILITGNDNHHKYLANCINEIYDLEALIIEEKKINIKTQLEKKRDRYEKKYFRENAKIIKKKINKLINCSNINNHQIIKKINTISPDFIICCGVSILYKKTLDNIKTKNILNLHGGNSLEYRGLDSHLWSIYHNDFKNIQVTLHFLNEKIDNGEIIMKKNINLNKINNLYELRLHNIKLCIRMIKKAINAYQKNKKFNKIKQKKIGRYYSSMPKELILITIQKFKKFVNNNGN